MMKIGVLADTHVKDRVRQLNPQIVPLLKQAGVSVILHAGDICSSQVIEELQTVAPVYPVRGNADVLLGWKYPLVLDRVWEDVRIVMMHGHGPFLRYLKDRILSILFGPRKFQYFEKQVLHSLPADTDVLIFGHIHVPLNRQQDGMLVFNPGSASIPVYHDRQPSIGILTIEEGVVSGEIIPLEKYREEDLTWLMRLVYRFRTRQGKKLPGLDLG